MRMHDAEIAIDTDLVRRLLTEQLPELADRELRFVRSTGTVNAVDGEPYADHLVTDEAQAAADLADFVLELRRADPTGAPPGGRAPLAELDAGTRTTITAAAAAADMIDASAGAGMGDPAMDVVAAWAVFGPTGRAVYRDRLAVDGTWNRARGYALHQAAAIIPYYRDTNPGFVALARRTIEEILSER